MAAKKKSKTRVKKKVASKKSAKTASTRKKSTVKKKAAAKKSAKKQPAAKKKKATTRKTSTKKVVTKKSVAKKTDSEAVKKSTPAKQKLSMGKSKKIGTKVKTLTGRVKGEKGVIVRQDAFLGTFFIVLERLQDNPVYKNIEWGPYFESQLEFVRK